MYLTLAFALVLNPPMKSDGTSYYPTQVGTKLTYQTVSGDFTDVVTAVEDKDGAKLVSVGHLVGDGKVVPREKVLVSGKGVAQVGQYPVMVSFDGEPLESVWTPNKTPVFKVKLPAKPGDKWEHEHEQNGVKITYTMGQSERVKVPAGEYLAVTVDIVRKAPGLDPMRFRYWYAPGVGAVKWTYDGGEIVLKSVTMGDKK